MSAARSEMDDFLQRVMDQRRLDDLARERASADRRRGKCEVCGGPVQNPNPRAKRCLDCKGVQQVAQAGQVEVYGASHPPPPLPDFSRCRICLAGLKSHNRSGHCRVHRPKIVVAVHMEDVVAVDEQHPNPEAQLPVPGTETFATAVANGAISEENSPEAHQTNGNGPSRRRRRRGAGKGRGAAQNVGKRTPVRQNTASKGGPAPKGLEEVIRALTPSGPSLFAVENLCKHLNAKALEFELAAKTIRSQAAKLDGVKDALNKLFEL